MKPEFSSMMVLRLTAAATLMAVVFVPGWASVLQDAGGYYCGPGSPGITCGGTTGGGVFTGGGVSADAVAIPTVSYWMLGAISIFIIAIAALQRRRANLPR